MPGPVLVERASPRSVRLSLTDRCDMACVYCRPSLRDGYLPAEDRLDPAQWEILVRGLVAQGVRRVRITGGEPLLFKGLVDVIARLRDLGVEDLALTTNASRLEHLAAPLRAAGLHRLNVSIDSLDAGTFARITRGGRLEEVLRGVDAALAQGFQEVKSNTVVLRGLNEHEPEDIVRWAWARGITPRFIEIMGVGEGGRIWKDRLVPAAETRRSIAHLLRDGNASQEPDRGPARYVPSRVLPGARVGFISGSTDTYCDGCDRLRATSDGVLRPCLSTNDGVSVAEDLKAGAGPEVVGERLREAWALKPDGRWKGCTEHTARAVNMRATGG
ncbi:MAG: radical SAM protein [Deltaproteobacteria bacterium]|nr:radical SAM protein [Deltaproteobacteria bacterium]